MSGLEIKSESHCKALLIPASTMCIVATTSYKKSRGNLCFGIQTLAFMYNYRYAHFSDRFKTLDQTLTRDSDLVVTNEQHLFSFTEVSTS